MTSPRKSLGQHWLNDKKSLQEIIKAADLGPTDTVLEIGSGQGALTRHLVARVRQVIAIELDPELVTKLPAWVPAKNLEVLQANILMFDLTKLPAGYIVVANIPYYLTSKLLQVLSESANPPTKMVLLVQKEVAGRICAGPGQMSILAISVQLYYKCLLGRVVPSELFTPPPKVDSQIIILDRRQTPLFPSLITSVGYDPIELGKFFRVVKAGFSARRKKLRGSLSGGLGVSKEEADRLLETADIDGDRRAQELSLEEWYRLSKLEK